MYRTPAAMARWTKLSATAQLVPIPSFVTFTPVLPSVTSGIGDFAGGAPRAVPAEARATPEAATLRNSRRLSPHGVSIIHLPPKSLAPLDGRHAAAVDDRGGPSTSLTSLKRPGQRNSAPILVDSRDPEGRTFSLG